MQYLITIPLLILALVVVIGGLIVGACRHNEQDRKMMDKYKPKLKG